MNEASGKEGFGVLDSKGREIGGCYVVWKRAGVTMTFEMYPHATRDGKQFGAIPVRAIKVVGSVEEGVREGEAYLARARARALKLQGGTKP